MVERRIREGREAEEEGDQEQVGREDGRDQHRHADAAEDDKRLACRSQRPSALDQVTRHPAAEEVPQIAAMKGTHTAIRPLRSSMPFATRKIGNQSVRRTTRIGEGPPMTVPQSGGA